MIQEIQARQLPMQIKKNVCSLWNWDRIEGRRSQFQFTVNQPYKQTSTNQNSTMDAVSDKNTISASSARNNFNYAKSQYFSVYFNFFVQQPTTQ
jgi:hypothetical protein